MLSHNIFEHVSALDMSSKFDTKHVSTCKFAMESIHFFGGRTATINKNVNNKVCVTSESLCVSLWL
jgi:hypothetical protein